MITAKQVDRVKPVLFLLGLYPLIRWVALGWQGELTANPTEFLTRSSGIWTLVCLLVTLLVTPLRDLFGQPALIRLRRLCGLFTFFYASLHTLAWAWWEQGFVLIAMAEDAVTRTFVSVGLAAFMVLLLLALTSSQRAMRALGRGWKRLHRWIYLAATLSIVHFWLHKAGKNDFAEVTIYAVLLSLLLAWRLWRWLKPETRRASASPSGPA